MTSRSPHRHTIFVCVNRTTTDKGRRKRAEIVDNVMKRDDIDAYRVHHSLEWKHSSPLEDVPAIAAVTRFKKRKKAIRSLIIL